MRLRSSRSIPTLTLALPLSVAALTVAAAAASPAAAASDPPPGRAYELVSPVLDPSGAPAGVSTDFEAMPARASEDGDRLLYGAGSVPGTTWSGPGNPMIFGRRTPTGWVARSAVRSVDEGNTPLALISQEAQSGWMTRDGTGFVFGVDRNLGSVPSDTVQAVYRAADADVAPDWLSRPNVGEALPGIHPFSITAANDTRTVVFSSTAPLTSDAPLDGSSAVYERLDGELRLVSRLPDGSVPGFTTLANSGTDSTAVRPPALAERNQLADNGRFVLFTTSGNVYAGPIYVRDLENDVTHRLDGGGSGAPTIANHLANGWGDVGQDVAATNMTVPDGLVFGAQKAPRAFFKPSRTDLSAPAALYEANLETGAVTARTAITGPPLGLTADGRRMVFIEPPASGSDVGDWTLRFWDAADPDASVAIGTITATDPMPPYGLARAFRSSADGSSWVFTAAGSPDPGRPNSAATTLQLYRWSVGDDHPTCLSCESTDGVARTSGVSLSVQESAASETLVDPTSPGSISDNPFKIKIAQPGRSLSDDGRWLLFDSPDRLVPEDVNDVRDVYLWDRDAAADGELQLVTRGVGGSPAYALDIDPTGRNAFFTTRDGLVPADVDGAYDVYTARIGGGFPGGSPESCSGESCRPPSGAPVGPVVGSVGFAGRGNPSPPAGSASVRVSGLKAVVGRVARLRVLVPGAGRVSVAGASIRQAGKSAGRAGTYTVRVALNPRARKALAKRERLRVAVRVSYRSASGQRVSRTVRVTFKQPKQVDRKGGR